MEKILFDKQYQGKKVYPFPSENLTQEQREGNEYFRAAINAILSKYFNNKCAIPYDAWGETRTIAELRAYRKGTNSPNKYKNWIVGLDERGRRLPTTLNISWDILQVLPEKIDAVKGYLQKIQYDPEINAIDYQSLIDKKTMVSMAKLLSDPRVENMRNMVNQVTGQNIVDQPDEADMPGGMQFSTPEQVDVASQVGVFFLEEEAALQNLLEKTQYESNFDSIDDLVDEDIITIGMTGKFIYTNPNTSMVMEDWVDVDRAMFPDSVYHDYHDITWGGQIKRYSIARLMEETDISEADAIRAARSYSQASPSGGMNNFYGDIASWRSDSQFGTNMWQQIEVDVADCRWIGKKGVNFTAVRDAKNKQLIVSKVGDDYKLSAKSEAAGKELHKNSGNTIYKGKMIVGTDIVFGCGEDNDIAFEKDTKGRLTPFFPYRFVRTGSTSLVDRCVGFVDDACLANYKLRVARKKMPTPPNIEISRSSLEGMKIDGVSYRPQDLIRLLENEGYLITDDKNQWGNQQGGKRAVTPIGTDLMSFITGWWEDINRSLMMIEKVTGINDLFSAQAPQRQTGLGVSKLMVAGTQNALYPLVVCKEYITEQPWRIEAKKWQVVATYMPKDQLRKLSINRSLKIVAMGSKMASRDFDLTIQAGISDEQKEQMIAELTNMRAAARQGGVASMSEADFLVIFELINSGKLKQAQLYTAFAVEKRKQEAKQEQQEMIQQNSQAQQQSAAQKGQIDQQTMQGQAQMDAALNQQKINQQTQGQIQLEIVKSQARQNELLLQQRLGLSKQSA